MEVRDNILLFKGPVTYDLAGIYMCDATNSIGTRSASVDVNVTGRTPPLSFARECAVCLPGAAEAVCTVQYVMLSMQVLLRTFVSAIERVCAAERACMHC